MRMVGAQPEAKSVYLCHVGDDSLMAASLASSLEQEGFSTWYYQRDAVARLPFLQQAARAVSGCHATILVISAWALRSDDFAAQVSEASQYGRLLIPILSGMTIDEFENHKPAWRPLLGATIIIDAGTAPCDECVRQIIDTLTFSGVPVEATTITHVDSENHATAVTPAIRGQAWATDASQIDIPDLRRVVFRNPQVDDFLQLRNKCFLVGTKGQGKTLLLITSPTSRPISWERQRF